MQYHKHTKCLVIVDIVCRFCYTGNMIQFGVCMFIILDIRRLDDVMVYSKGGIYGRTCRIRYGWNSKLYFFQ